MRAFPPSTIAHPWRDTLVLFAVSAVWMVALYELVALIQWGTSLLPSEAWSFVPVVG